ncbi:hypothetical protein Fmac_017910 [Flemingia macrophylla]|uniref:Remorin C-terminal domain-containing protein n=1 Tax=Flemingia macrophylla TaxID=520843 RepID=A0ABD1M3I3_9FABA
MAAELQTKPETALVPAPVVTEAPPNDAVAANKASETEESKTKDSVPSPPENIVLAEVEKEKKLSYVKAWEESERAKAENRQDFIAEKNLCVVAAWENGKKAVLEAELKKFEEQLEKKKAKYAEKMKNKMALVHKEAEEKRAVIEAKRREELLKAQEMAEKYRATGTTPKKTIGCF